MLIVNNDAEVVCFINLLPKRILFHVQVLSAVGIQTELSAFIARGCTIPFDFL